MALPTNRNKGSDIPCSTLQPKGMGAYVPVVRPHNRRCGQDIFFMISKRPLLQLSPDEIGVYDGIDGSKTVARLEEMHEDTRDWLLRWWQSGIIELIPPIASPAAPHLVVVEPHMDDAVLSAGGRLLQRRGQCRISILSIVDQSNFTSYLSLKRPFLDVGEVTEIRERESALVGRLLGAEHRHLDWADAPLRTVPAARWSSATIEQFTRNPQLFVRVIPNPREVSLVAEQLLRKLSTLAPDELWIPMGLGNHVDHRIARSACLRVLAEAPSLFSDIPVLMYEDLPYAPADDQARQIRSVIASCGGDLVRGAEDITDVFEEKLRLVSVYASQFKLSYMEPAIRRCATREGDAPGRLMETYYRFERRPGLLRVPSDWQFSLDCEDLAALQREVGALRLGRSRWRRVTVLVLPSSHLGEWAANRDSLAAAFPEAHVRVYASGEVAWQAEEGGNDRVMINIVHRGWPQWAVIICCEALRFGTPTFVVWRGAYCHAPFSRVKKLINAFLKSFLLFRPVFYARMLCDACCVLSDRIDEGQL